MYSAITIFFSLYTLRRAKEYNIRIVYKSYILLLLSLWRSFNTITSQRACNFLVSNNKRPLRDPWHFNMHCLDHRCSRVLLKSGDCWWDHIPMSHHSLLQQFLTFTDMYMECNLTKKKLNDPLRHSEEFIFSCCLWVHVLSHMFSLCGSLLLSGQYTEESIQIFYIFRHLRCSHRVQNCHRVIQCKIVHRVHWFKSRLIHIYIFASGCCLHWLNKFLHCTIISSCL